MKGLKIERAKPSNGIDIYALMKLAAEEGTLLGKPTAAQLKSYYLTGLLNELASPAHLYFVARRGRGILGYVHAFYVSDRWGGMVSQVAVDTVFVTKARRKMGVGKKLLDELVKHVENVGIKRVEFACPAEQMQYWSKERKANATQVIMGVDL